MKSLIVFFVCTCIAIHTFSQNKFTKATLDGIIKEYIKDSKTFFTSRLSSDFRYITPEGKFQGREDIIAGDRQKIVSTEIQNLVIIQSGNLAIISGLHKTVRTEDDASQSTTLLCCSYTFQLRNGKWMFVASQQTNAAPGT